MTDQPLYLYTCCAASRQDCALFSRAGGMAIVAAYNEEDAYQLASKACDVALLPARLVQGVQVTTAKRGVIECDFHIE